MTTGGREPRDQEQRAGGRRGRADPEHRIDGAALGARYVLLDTYADAPEATRDPEVAWRMLRTLAERVLDLPREGLR